MVTSLPSLGVRSPAPTLPSIAERGRARAVVRTPYIELTERLQVARARIGTSQLNDLARAYISCPRVKAISLSALKGAGASYDSLDDVISSCWMILQTKYAPTLLEGERIYQLTAAIMSNLSAREMVDRAKASRNVSFSVIEGRAAEKEDFAAFGDHIRRVADHTGVEDLQHEAFGLAESAEAIAVRRVTVQQFGVRLAAVPRPGGVAAAKRDTELATRTRAPSDHAQILGFDPWAETNQLTDVERLRRLSLCMGIPMKALSSHLQWQEYHWNDVVNQRLHQPYADPNKVAARQLDLTSLADAEKSYLTADVTNFIRSAVHLTPPALVAVFGKLLACEGDNSEATAKNIEAHSPRINASRWLRRPPHLKARVLAYLTVRGRSVTAATVTMPIQ